MELKDLHREISDIRFSCEIFHNRLDVRVGNLEKNVERLQDKLDSFTWKMLLTVIGAVAAQHLLKLLP